MFTAAHLQPAIKAEDIPHRGQVTGALKPGRRRATDTGLRLDLCVGGAFRLKDKYVKTGKM